MALNIDSFSDQATKLSALMVITVPVAGTLDIEFGSYRCPLLLFRRNDVGIFFLFLAK
jgi:hypothetical protein